MQRCQARVKNFHSRSVIVTSSHHYPRYDELQVTRQEKSVGSPLIPDQRGHEVGETSGQGGGEGSTYEDDPKE